MVSARIRGIYSTALTKLLLNHDFEIVQPSAGTTLRFTLEESSRDPDLDILERKDKKGVLALGTSQSIQVFRTVLFETLIDVVVRGSLPPISRVSRFSLNFEFPGYSKSKLDEIRETVTPTIRGHHFYKTCGGRISSAVDMAENLLVKGRSRDEVERLFKGTISPSFPLEGSVIEISHIKLVGPPFNLGKAVIERFDKDRDLVSLRRRLRGGGAYNGLGVKKSPEDYALTEARLGEWYLITRYFSKEGDLKGTYVNLNTPIELYPHCLRYVDLEVDICVWPDGKMKVLDMEVLNNAVTGGLASTRLLEFICRKTDELTKKLRHIPPDPYQPVQ